jgi:hypothetical protein
MLPNDDEEKLVVARRPETLNRGWAFAPTTYWAWPTPSPLDECGANRIDATIPPYLGAWHEQLTPMEV